MFSISVGAEWTAQKVSQAAVHQVRINFALEETKIITVPTGYCEIPHEIVRPPRSVAEQVLRDIRRCKGPKGQPLNGLLPK
jgi:hypothetical protein